LGGGFLAVSVLQIPLLAVTDSGLDVNAEVSGAELQPEGAADLPMGSIRLTGTLSGDGEEFIFHGSLEGTYLGNCDRCLGPAEKRFQTEILWVFVHGTPPQPSEELEDKEGEEDFDDGVIRTFIEDNVLDLRTAAWEEAVLGAPLKLLCSEDCAGLCPVCGTNLNEARCTCSESETDTSLANKGLKGLKDLFPRQEN
jgi:uncharacterized protein